MEKIVPYLWYDSEAKQAIDFYMSLFKDSEIIVAQKSEETTSNNNGDFYDFKLAGLLIGAFNGGPFFKLNSSISFTVHCDTKEEVQKLWDSFIDRGTELVPLKTYDFSGYYGWVKDRYGVSWQIVPSNLSILLSTGTREQREAVTQTYLPMKKLDFDELKQAWISAKKQ